MCTGFLERGGERKKERVFPVEKKTGSKLWCDAKYDDDGLGGEGGGERHLRKCEKGNIECCEFITTGNVFCHKALVNN